MLKKSVLMVVDKYPATYGHTTVINNLCVELRRLGVKVAIGAFRFDEKPPDNIEYLKFNKKLYELNYSILITLIFTIFYLYFYLDDINKFPSWVEQPDLKFYTNFYFSKFFGSRLVGLIHLIILKV